MAPETLLTDFFMSLMVSGPIALAVVVGSSRRCQRMLQRYPKRQAAETCAIAPAE